ncbi:Alpha/Beta hydrolase protein [Aspergillus lucknowensis]|uniref:Alpha/Beta hydrolase protein n=1 Tax=Aspergillus lucknowensis TaxID=176173 RepID=A0ABR4LYC8_9EURO
MWMNTNGNGLIAVEIQYRLGTFGFLSSPEGGFKYIFNFGGDPSRVTLADEPSGAGAIMHLAMAYGGEDSFTWALVIHGAFVKKLPSEQLLLGQLGGRRLLVGSHANEDVPFIDPAIGIRDQFDDFIATNFPLFTKADELALKKLYRIDDIEDNSNDIRFDTLRDRGPTGLNLSSYATGIEQAAFNIAGETTFHCPAQWLGNTSAPSHHGADLPAYFAVDATKPSADFRHAIQKIWGSFIINNSPVISVEDSTGGYENATVPSAAM